MAEYIERGTAIAKLTALEVSKLNATMVGAKRLLAEIPAADVAPVVRCKECEHAERYERTDGTAGYCCGHPQNTFAYGERWDRVFKPVKEADDVCSYGERKDEADAEG